MSDVAAPDASAGVGVAAPPAPGFTPPSRRDRQGVFLTDVIFELGFAEQDAVKEAVDAARRSGKTPERCLLDSGAIDEHQLSLALAERNGLDHVDLELCEVDPEAVGLIDKTTAARYNALPVAFGSDGELIVAFEELYDTLGISDIEVMTKSDVRPVVGAGTQIRRLIERLPERPPVQPPQSPDESSAPGSLPEPALQPEPKPAPAPEAELTEEPEPAPVTEPVPEPAPQVPDPAVAGPPPPEPASASAAPLSDETGELSATLLSLQEGTATPPP
jgi:hypothetical protein